MSNIEETILIKRGLEKDLPTLSVGEPGFTTDTHKLFIGTSNGNVQIANINDVNSIQTPSVIPNSYSWISTDGQDTFSIPSGKFFDIKLMSVTVGGVIQPNITLINDTTFQLPEPLNIGVNVYVEWYESAVPITGGHHTTHEVNGSDEIDITKLKNYDTLINNNSTMSNNITDLLNRTKGFLNLNMYNAKGDGTTDDTSVFTSIEANYTNIIVDLAGKTYLVTSLPTNNYYINGKFSFNNNILDASYISIFRANHGVIAIGLHAADNAPSYPNYTGDLYYKNIAIGGYALQNSTASYDNIALGWNSLFSHGKGEHYNIGIGNESLYNTNKSADDTDSFTATRNIGIGMNSMYFNVKGYQNIGIGRNALQCTVNGNQNTALGANAMSGSAPLDLTGNIINLTKYDSNNVTAIGYSSLQNNVANDNTAVGSNSAQNVAKAVNTVAVGKNSLNTLQKDMTTDGNNKIYWSKTGTYNWDDMVITVTIYNHGLQNGYLISLALTSGDNQYTEENQYIISNVSTDTFSIEAPISKFITGDVSSSWYSDQTVNVNISDNNTAIGAFAMENSQKGQDNVAIGTWANRNNNGDMNAMVGVLAGTNITSGNNNAALGYGALRYNQDGTDCTSVNGSTAIGANTRVSGNNQVQLGSSGTTAYVYGSVQDRSDQRDKADIQNTALGLDFINKLRPVDFKWDYRDDYIEVDNETGKVTILPKDGSKKRVRFHHGVIAQEVKQIIDETGIDFGGYQDHKIDGGNDVLTIGYEEFVAPLIKAVQELTARVKELESKIQ